MKIGHSADRCYYRYDPSFQGPRTPGFTPSFHLKRRFKVATSLTCKFWWLHQKTFVILIVIQTRVPKTMWLQMQIIWLNTHHIMVMSKFVLAMVWDSLLNILVFQTFQNFKAQAELQLGFKIKCLQSNLGGGGWISCFYWLPYYKWHYS